MNPSTSLNSLKTSAKLFLLGALLALAPVDAFGDEHCPFPNYNEPNLPNMESCINSEPKPLPEAWEAVTLMAPYLYESQWPNGADLQVGLFVYDSTELPLMRVTRYGVQEETIVDLLISEGVTWNLYGDYNDPTCERSNKTYSVPSRVWQSPELEAQCVGSHPTAPRMVTGPDVDWWKQRSPSQAPGAKGLAGDWYWFDVNGFPTRTFFWENNPRLPAILGEYAYTNFYDFEPVTRTNLPEIYHQCLSETLVRGSGNENSTKTVLHGSLPRSNHPGSISDLIPGLSADCTGAEPPYWPEHMYATTFMTAAKYDTPEPLSTSVYYNSGASGGVPRIRTRLHKEEDGAPYFSDALLIGNSSFGIDTEDKPGYPQKVCVAGPLTSLPGAPYPDWGSRNPCTCMGTIDDNPILSPGRKTQLIGCPLPSQYPSFPGDTIFWMWYTMESPPQPVVFLQTKADITLGTGLCIADYFSWETPEEQCDNIFDEPSQCIPLRDGVPPLPSCLKCHAPSTNGPTTKYKSKYWEW